MHNREITHIVETDSLSKTQLIVRNRCSFFISFERNICQNQIQNVYENTMQKLHFYFNDSNSLITSLCIEYIGGIHDLKSERSNDF